MLIQETEYRVMGARLIALHSELNDIYDEYGSTGAEVVREAVYAFVGDIVAQQYEVPTVVPTPRLNEEMLRAVLTFTLALTYHNIECMSFNSFDMTPKPSKGCICGVSILFKTIEELLGAEA